MKNTWKGINQIININSKGKKIPSSLIVNKTHIQWQVVLMSIFLLLPKKIQAKVYHLGTDFSEYLDDMNEYNFFIKPINPVEIINTIIKLDCNKATGPYSIPNEILHLIKMNIADPLSILINLSFEKSFLSIKSNIVDTSNY